MGSGQGVGSGGTRYLIELHRVRELGHEGGGGGWGGGGQGEGRRGLNSDLIKQTK